MLSREALAGQNSIVCTSTQRLEMGSPIHDIVSENNAVVQRSQTETDSSQKAQCPISHSNKQSVELQSPEAASAQRSTRSLSDKKVTWGEIEIKTYNVVLSSNPAVSKGPPIEIGWVVLQNDHMDLDLYEKYRPPPREKLELLLPHSYRECWLRELGYSRGQMREVLEEIQSIQAKRRASARRSPFQRLQCVLSYKGKTIFCKQTDC